MVNSEELPYRSESLGVFQGLIFDTGGGGGGEGTGESELSRLPHFPQYAVPGRTAAPQTHRSSLGRTFPQTAQNELPDLFHDPQEQVHPPSFRKCFPHGTVEPADVPS